MEVFEQHNVFDIFCMFSDLLHFLLVNIHILKFKWMFKTLTLNLLFNLTLK